jgi:hypothetical protein
MLSFWAYLGSLYLQVVLAANDMPSINDVTYTELIEIIAKVIERICRGMICWILGFVWLKIQFSSWKMKMDSSWVLICQIFW